MQQPMDNLTCPRCDYLLPAFPDIVDCPKCGAKIVDTVFGESDNEPAARSGSTLSLRIAVSVLPFVCIGLMIASVAIAENDPSNRRVPIGLLVVSNLIAGMACSFGKRLNNYTGRTFVGSVWAGAVMWAVVIWDLVVVIAGVLWLIV